MSRLYVSNKDESVKMFKNNFLEKLTKVHWSVPPLIFMPVICYFLYVAWQVPTLGINAIILLIIGGLFIWTITEYVLHRFVFHYQPPGELGAKLHFLFHGVHHDYPNDSMRLVMPPAVSIPLAYLFYTLFKCFFANEILYPFFSGFLIGYLGYDMLHYAIHHLPWKGKVWMTLKTHHLKHHFKDPDKGYGVSSPVWDKILGTQFSAYQKKK